MEGQPTAAGRWILIGFGLFFLYGAFHMYREFAALEATGGTMRINWLFGWLYRALGKWGVSAFFVLMGGFFLYGAFRRPEAEE